MQCDPKKITTKDFTKLELRIGEIKGVQWHENKKDYILLLDLGPAERDLQIVANLKDGYDIEGLMNKQCVIILNICSEEVDGVESEALLLIATKDEKPVLISPETAVPTGEKILGIMDSEMFHHTKIGE